MDREIAALIYLGRLLAAEIRRQGPAYPVTLEDARTIDALADALEDAAGPTSPAPQKST